MTGEFNKLVNYLIFMFLELSCITNSEGFIYIKNTKFEEKTTVGFIKWL
jgi:hypothetical protein